MCLQEGIASIDNARFGTVRQSEKQESGETGRREAVNLYQDSKNSDLCFSCKIP